MIPKIIHYCWLSNDPIPQDLQKCMNSWNKYLPDYEFKLWNFDCFDINSSKWVKVAFENKKYAFAADYIRLYALYNYGGIYLDMDVEVLKSFDSFLHQHEILCYQNGRGLEVAAFGAEKESLWIKECLDYYENRSFLLEDGNFDMLPLPCVVENVLKDNHFFLKNIRNEREYSYECDSQIVQVLPYDYFSPKSYITGKIALTDNTVSIHHFASTWVPWYELFEKRIWGLFGKRNKCYMNKIINLFRKMKKCLKK